MANGFYKHIHIIKWCTVCGKEWHPARYSWQDRRCICTDCVNKEVAEWRKANPNKWAAIVSRYRKQARKHKPQWAINEYTRWQLWVERNKERRREIARQSYYRNQSHAK